MADPGRAWLALSGAHAETGLVPVLLPGPGSEDAEPVAPLSGWDFGFAAPKDITLLDSMPAADVLAEDWRSAHAPDEARAPSGHGFPGLAPAGHTPFAAVTLHGAVGALAAGQPFRLGLVAARRPADVPALTGWDGNGDGPGTAARSLRISAVLRSWEDRFGARLLRMGIDDELWVLTERPPATLEAALLLAAEHQAFADEWGEYAQQPASELAPLLMEGPAWRFWWDLQRPGGGTRSEQSSNQPATPKAKDREADRRELIRNAPEPPISSPTVMWRRSLCGTILGIMSSPAVPSCSVDASDSGRAYAGRRRDPRRSASDVGRAFRGLGEVGLGHHGPAGPGQYGDYRALGHRR